MCMRIDSLSCLFLCWLSMSKIVALDQSVTLLSFATWSVITDLLVSAAKSFQRLVGIWKGYGQPGQGYSGTLLIHSHQWPPYVWVIARNRKAIGMVTVLLKRLTSWECMSSCRRGMCYVRRGRFVRVSYKSPNVQGQAYCFWQSCFFMADLCNRATIIFLSCGFFLLSFFFSFIT